MSPIWYAHPDGFLRHSGTGDIGPAWNSDRKLSATERAALHTACESAGALVYMPGPKSTGLLPGTDLASLAPYGDGTTVVAGSWGTTALSEKIVWGALNPITSGGTGSSITNSAIAGPRPDLVAANGGSQAWVRETNITTARIWTATHCIFNSLLWTMPELDPPGGAWDLDEALFLLKDSIGFRGGRMRVSFCDISCIQDPMNLSSILADLTTDELITAWTGGNPAGFRHNWIHQALFYRGPLHGQPEGTHSDLMQWSKPQYMDIAYQLFGGPNGDRSGYALTPSQETSDGAHNAGIMAQQEDNNSNNPLYQIKNITVRRNLFWMHSGSGQEANGWNINHNYKDVYPNDMETVSFTDNLHVQRSDEHYVIASPVYWPRHSGHRIVTINPDGESWTDVGAVTIANGG